MKYGSRNRSKNASGRSIDWNAINRQSYEALGADPAPGQEDDPRLRRQTRRLFMERLNGKRILELGFGTASDALSFWKAGLEVCGIDFCRTAVEEAKKRYAQLDLRHMDMTDLRFHDGRLFDGIFGFASFIHLPRKHALPTLRALYELLSKDGVLYLVLISSSCVREYVIEDWGERKDNPVLFTCYSEEEFSELLCSAGFESSEILHVPSAAYDRLPRLLERGVRMFHAVGYKLGASRRFFQSR